MKDILVVFGGILAVTGIIMVLSCRMQGRKYEFTAMSCVSGQSARSMAETVMPEIMAEGVPDMENIKLQVIYRMARRSIVRIAVKEAAGSGIIWRLDDGIVIVSSRHLLMGDVRAEVTFGSGETVEADVLGYSQQYDIGFVRISGEAVTDSILRGVCETVPVLYESESEEARDDFARRYFGKLVLQVGAVIDKGTADFSTGTIKGLGFVPLFNTTVLETACYSRAGMSGGGVFDGTGRLLGMISGGYVPEGAEIREADLTYSLPPLLIEMEYNQLDS